MRAAVLLALGSVLLAGCQLPVEPPFDPGPPPVAYEVRHASGWQWAVGPPLVLAVSEPACLAIDDRLWVAGGIDSHGAVRAFTQVYDRVTDAWSREIPLRNSVHSAMAWEEDGLPVIAGGYESSGSVQRATDRVQRMEPPGIWVEVKPSLPGPLAEAAVIQDGDFVYLAGGSADHREATDEILFLNQDAIVRQWRTPGHLTQPRADGVAFSFTPEQFVVVGGWNHSKGWPLTDALLQRLDGDALRAWPTMPTPRSETAGTSWHPFPFFIGGRGLDGNVTGAVEFLDIVAEEWFRTTPMPEPRAGACAVPMDDGIHVLGGVDQDGAPQPDHWVLRPTR